jgi:hypothetical protein
MSFYIAGSNVPSSLKITGMDGSLASIKFFHSPDILSHSNVGLIIGCKFTQKSCMLDNCALKTSVPLPVLKGHFSHLPFLFSCKGSIFAAG